MRSVMKWRLGFIILSILMITSPGASQDYYIEDFDLNPNLTDKYVETIFQDSRGFIWAGTAFGLNFYDGNVITPYHTLSGSGKPVFHYVKDIAEDENGTIWFATFYDGLIAYSYETDSFRQYLHDPEDLYSIESNKVYCLAAAGASIWCGTERGVERIDVETSEAVHYYVPSVTESGVPAAVEKITYYPEKDLVIALSAGRLYSLVASSETQTFSRFEFAEGILENQQILYLETIDGILYTVSDEPAIHAIDLSNSSISEARPTIELGPAGKNFTVNDLALLKGGVLMLATNHGLVWGSNSSGWTNEVYSRGRAGGLRSNTILKIEIDNTGYIWLATAAGIQTINPHMGTFRQLNTRDDSEPHFAHLPDSVYALTEDAYWGVFGFVRNKGFYRLSLEDGSMVPFELTVPFRHFSKNKVYDICRAAHDELIIPIFNGVIRAPVEGENRVAGAYYNLFGSAIVRAGEVTDDGAVLLGTNSFNDIHSYSPKEGSLLTGDGLAALLNERGEELEGVYDIESVSDEEVWISFYNSLVRYDPSRRSYQKYSHYPDLEDSDIPFECLTIYQDSSNTVWFGTTMGLYHSVNGNGGIQAFDLLNVSPYNTVFCMTEDEVSRLWLGMKNGLVMLDPASGISMHFTSMNGLPFNEFNLDSALLLEDGTIVMGGVDGAIHFDPLEFTYAEYSSPVVLTGVYIQNNRLETTAHHSQLAEFSLEHDQELVTLLYAVQDYRKSSVKTMQYRLSSDDAGWRPMEAGNMLILNNLEPGEHTIEVRGKNSLGVWSESPHRLAVKVAPPFYQTPWFMGLTLALLVASFAAAHLYRTYSIQKSNLRLRDINESLEKAVREKDRVGKTLRNSQERLKSMNRILNKKIEEIYKLNDELKTFNYSISNVLKVPIRHISGYSEMMKTMMEEENPEQVLRLGGKISEGVTELKAFIDGLRLLTQVKEHDFSRESFDFSAMCRAFVERFIEESGDSKVHFKIQPGIRVRGDATLIKLLRNCLMDNAIRFAGDSPVPEVTIETIKYQDQTHIAISDSGPGFEEAIREKIFEPFYSYHTIGDFSGTGLSLSIVKRIVERHRGMIHARNRPEGGAIFHFSLDEDDSWLELNH